MVSGRVHMDGLYVIYVCVRTSDGCECVLGRDDGNVPAHVRRCGGGAKQKQCGQARLRVSVLALVCKR